MRAHWHSLYPKVGFLIEFERDSSAHRDAVGSVFGGTVILFGFGDGLVSRYRLKGGCVSFVDSVVIIFWVLYTFLIDLIDAILFFAMTAGFLESKITAFVEVFFMRVFFSFSFLGFKGWIGHILFQSHSLYKLIFQFSFVLLATQLHITFFIFIFQQTLPVFAPSSDFLENKRK